MLRRTIQSSISQRQGGFRAASTVVESLRASVASLPLRDVVRYTKKNARYTAKEIQSNADAHANALLEMGFKPGENLAVWMGESGEKLVTMLAAIKIGLVVTDVDASINSIADVREFLFKSNPRYLFFEKDTDEKDNLLLLRKAIPEFYYYDDTHGQIFHSKYIPALKYFVQTGFDTEMGCLTYKSLFNPSPQVKHVEKTEAALTDDTPAYRKITKGPNGLEFSDVYKHGDLLKLDGWKYCKNIIDKVYFELP